MIINLVCLTLFNTILLKLQIFYINILLLFLNCLYLYNISNESIYLKRLFKNYTCYNLFSMFLYTFYHRIGFYQQFITLFETWNYKEI